MAIRKVSRLQHRRGLKSDLPIRLHEGELGWCLDTRELFIGNSDASPGNSQILTEYTPNDAIITHVYKGNTGIPSATIARTLGSKLDDFINVRDYGAIGNGITDDTVPLQLAITDCYNKTVANGFDQLQSYVTIYIPAGTYRITETLKLWPYLKLQGEGSYRTVITLDNETALCIAETADSNGNTGANIGLNSAVVPAYIDICDIGFFQSNISTDGLWLNRCNNINLTNVKIVGPRVYNSGIVTSSVALNIQSYGTTSSLIPYNITLDKVEITGFNNAIYTNDPIKDLHLHICHIHDCANGLTLGDVPILGGPSMTKISSGVFRYIENHAVSNKGNNLGVICTGNSFDTVGLVGNTSAIVWGPISTGCASIADQFLDVISAFISNQNPAFNSIIGPQRTGITIHTPDLIGPVTLANNHPITAINTTISYDVLEYNTIIINYSLNRDTNKQVGKLTILTNGTTAIIEDDYNTLGVDLGVTFGFRIVDGILTITYQTTNTGFDATMYYSETKWFA